MITLLYYSADWIKPKPKITALNGYIINAQGSINNMQNAAYENNANLIILIGFKGTKQTLNAITAIFKDSQDTSFAFYSPSPKPDFLLECMHLGITEIFTEFNKKNLLNAISNIQKKSESKPRKKTIKRQCIGFISAKGGDGASFVSANFAAGLAKSNEHKILIIDLSLPFGDVDMFLTNKKSTYDLVDFANSIQRLDDPLIESMVQKISPNLHLIPSPRDYERAMTLTQDLIFQLLDLVRATYDFVILDFSEGINPLSIGVLDKLEHLYIVLSLSLPSIRKANQILSLCENIENGTAIAANKISAVINARKENFDLNVKNVESALERRIKYVVPYDYEVLQESLLKGMIAINVNPKSNFSKFMEEWATKWTGSTSIKKESSLWTRIRKKTGK
jgi:pilus assembly protein CpaE